MKKEEIREVESGAQKPDYVFTWQELLENDVQEMPMLWKPFFPKTGIAGLIGGSDTGKSTLLRHFAMNLVSGEKEFLGYPLSPIHQSALYLSTEDDKNALSYLMQVQSKNSKTGIDREKLRFIFGSQNIHDRIRDEYERAPFDCLIIDAITDIFSGDINRNNDVRHFLQVFLDHAEENEYLVIFVHHSGKASEFKGPSKHNSIGSQGFEAKMRFMAELIQDPDDGSIRHFCPVKGNYIPFEMKNQSMALRFNENLLYENTGILESFDDLRYRIIYKDKRAEIRLAHELKKQGFSLRGISEEAKNRGFDFGKTKAAELLKISPN